MPSNLPTYSFVVTLYNDGYLAEAFCVEFLRVFRAYTGHQEIDSRVELIFVNDGSKDDTLARIRALALRFPFVKAIDLSRNYGQHIAILCGYHHASGTYVGRLNVDMQDPPHEIPKLLAIIENEAVDLVVGIQQERQSKWLDKVTARVFFVVFNWLTSQSIPFNTSTLRVMSRRFVDLYKRVNDKQPFMQGLETWFGFEHRYVVIDHQARVDKRSSYTFGKRLALAIDAAISFSDKPLRVSVVIGGSLASLGVIAIACLILWIVIFGGRVPGYGSLILAVTFFSGLQIMLIGLAGLYVGKVLLQVQDRPTYVIRQKIGAQSFGIFDKGAVLSDT